MDMGSVFKNVVREAVREVLQDELRLLRHELAATVSTQRKAAVPSRLMSTKQAAEYAGVSEGTIRAWVGAGFVRCGRTEHALRLRQEDIDAYLFREKAQEAPAFDAKAIAEEVLRPDRRR